MLLTSIFLLSVLLVAAVVLLRKEIRSVSAKISDLDTSVGVMIDTVSHLETVVGVMAENVSSYQDFLTRLLESMDGHEPVVAEEKRAPAPYAHLSGCVSEEDF